MKAKHLLAVAALCLFSSHASAQSTDWNGIYFQYNPSWFTFNVSDTDNEYFHGFTLGYVKSIPVAGKNLPLFLEVGGNLQYGLYSESRTVNKKQSGVTVKAEASDKIHMLSLNVPVNFGYSIKLSDGLALNPYIGLKLRLNLMGLETIKGTVQVGNAKQTESETVNLYSSSEENMGDSELTWNRFQIGWQFGTKLIVSNSLFVEAGFGTDFSRIAKHTRTMSVNLGFGYMF